eukprot:354125-Chlamydomonas_euryale.AAC.3
MRSVRTVQHWKWGWWHPGKSPPRSLPTTFWTPWQPPLVLPPPYAALLPAVGDTDGNAVDAALCVHRAQPRQAHHARGCVKRRYQGFLKALTDFIEPSMVASMGMRPWWHPFEQIYQER